MSNGSRVLEILRANYGKTISGELVSNSLGISRSATWKQIKSLRDKGYRISARSRSGYCLEAEPELSDERFSTEENVFFKDSVDSTNLAAHRLAEEGAPGFTTVIAEQQLAGRGRLGRSWYSPAGCGLWFSVIFRPKELTPAAAGPITLVAATVITRYLSTEYSLPVQIKWPNDLQIGGKKIAGILTEIKSDLDRIDYLIIGIGLNVNQEIADFPIEIANLATSLAIEADKKIKRADLFLGLRQALMSAYGVFEKEGFTPFRQAWKAHNITLGRQVKISWPGGFLTGLALELTDEGKLVVKDHDARIHLVNYGEVS